LESAKFLRSNKNQFTFELKWKHNKQQLLELFGTQSIGFSVRYYENSQPKATSECFVSTFVNKGKRENEQSEDREIKKRRFQYDEQEQLHDQLVKIERTQLVCTYANQPLITTTDQLKINCSSLSGQELVNTLVMFFKRYPVLRRDMTVAENFAWVSGQKITLEAYDYRLYNKVLRYQYAWIIECTDISGTKFILLCFKAKLLHLLNLNPENFPQQEFILLC